MKKLLVMLLLFSACAGTNVQTSIPFEGFKEPLRISINTSGHEVPDKAMQIFRNRLNDLMREKGLYTTSLNTSVLEITFTNYYMRHGATRWFAGIMAGRDQILSDVKVIDRGKNTIARFEVNSTNPTAYKTAHSLLEDHAEEIVDVILEGSE